MDLSRVRKAVASAATGVATVVSLWGVAVSDGNVENEEWGGLAAAVVVAVLGTWAVWRVRNEPEPQPDPELPEWTRTGQWNGPPLHQ